MRLIRGLQHLQHWRKPSVVVIGKFDGVHRGHQAVITQAKLCANTDRLPVVIILFEPQPHEYFQPNKTFKRIQRLRDKLLCFKQSGVDAVVVLKFNENLANMSAERFIQGILIDALQAQHVIVGEDFRFGAKRQGDVALLRSSGNKFTTHIAQTLSDGDRRISSTWVREAIESNDFMLAERLLGHPYQLSGRVRHGDKRGRLLGFPTLNILLEHPMVVHGVYVVKIAGLGAEAYCGVANVGRRPTIGGHHRLLEVYVLGYQGDAYGQPVTITFLEKLRNEQKFDNVASLKAQIAQDVSAAKQFLSHYEKVQAR